MKKVGWLFFMLLTMQGYAQDVAALMQEGKMLEQKFKEEEAIVKYKQAADTDPKNIAALVKLAELSLNIGSRLADPVAKKNYYLQAKSYADDAMRISITDADALFIMSSVYGKLTEVEEKRETIVEDVKLSRLYALQAIGADPKHGKAYNALGRWHYEMLTLNALKKAAVKLLYGGLPPASIDSCINYFEKCKTLEPYYCQNFYDLGKAYNYNKQYEKAIAVLQQLAKLPTRRQDDPAIKSQGAVLLQQLQ
jgi:tetratricopeptide (TPR) repeat protein